MPRPLENIRGVFYGESIVFAWRGVGGLHGGDKGLEAEIAAGLGFSVRNAITRRVSVVVVPDEAAIHCDNKHAAHRDAEAAQARGQRIHIITQGEFHAMMQWAALPEAQADRLSPGSALAAFFARLHEHKGHWRRWCRAQERARDGEPPIYSDWPYLDPSQRPAERPAPQ